MKNSLENIKIYFQEYCNHTSIHGFQYFGEKKRHIFERFWWLIIFSVCLCGCTVSIYFVYKKWEWSPVIVSFANKGTPIYEIPFPAFTICPESKSDQTKFNFTKIMQMKEDGVELSSSEKIYFEYMLLICNNLPELDNYTKMSTFSEEFFDFLDFAKPKFEVVECTFLKRTQKNCDEVFTPMLTDVGICYTFNMLDRYEIFEDSVVQYKDYHTSREKGYWSLQNGYDNNAGVNTYPVRAYLSGATHGFSLTLMTPKQDLDYSCGDLQGYRVILHTPMTIPRPSQKFFRIPLDLGVMGAIQPTMITTSTRVKAYDPKRRKCYFGSERRLKYFKNYTLTSCNLECLTNITLVFCGCVNFFMPRENGTEICGTQKIECMNEAEEFCRGSSLFVNLDKNISRKAIYTLQTYNCKCLPVCADLTYNAEISQTEWEWKKKLEVRRRLPRIDNKSHLSSLTLFFTSDYFITSERNELYGPTDFLANFGGLLGLFTGFSVLSLMEILYFLSVRIICNLRLFGRWTGAEH